MMGFMSSILINDSDERVASGFVLLILRNSGQIWWEKNVCLGNHFRLFNIGKEKKKNEDKRGYKSFSSLIFFFVTLEASSPSPVVGVDVDEQLEPSVGLIWLLLLLLLLLLLSTTTFPCQLANSTETNCFKRSRY